MTTPEEVRRLIEAAERSRRPEYARAILVAATTRLRRAEMCALRRQRTLALDEVTLAMLRAQIQLLEQRAALARADVLPDAYVFSDDIAGAVPWKPDAVSQYFGRLRERAGLGHLDFHDLRRFHGDLRPGDALPGRPGGDARLPRPSVAARHYSGRVVQTDRDLAQAVASLLTSTS